MIAKIEGHHAWTPPGASEPAIILGRTHDDTGELVWPRFKLLRITGLGSTGEPEDNRDRPPGQSRETPRLSRRRGATVVYEGEVKARSLLELREAEALFSAAFDGLETEGRMDVSWHPLLAEFEEVPAKFYEARALTADIIDVQATTRWDRPFVVGLRKSDRRYFDANLMELSVDLAEQSSEYHFAPIEFAPHNRQPLLEVDYLEATEKEGMPREPLVLRNVSTGESLTLRWLFLPDGKKVFLDFEKRTIVDVSGKNVSVMIDPEEDSSLWARGLRNGDNDLVVESPGGKGAYGATATLSWRRGYV